MSRNPIISKTAAGLDLPALPSRWAYDYSRQTLASGLTLITVNRPKLHHCCIMAFIGTGSRFEGDRDNGLSHFLEHMMFRGTLAHPTALDLNLSFERLGGTLGAATTPDTTEYFITLPLDTVHRGIEAIGEVLIRPRMTEIELERRIIVEEITEDLDERGEPIDIDFLSRQRLWPAHALGQSVTGPIANVERFTNEDLRRWYEQHYCAENTVICVGGPLDPVEIARRVQQNMDELPRGGTRRVATPPDLPTGCTVLHKNKPGSQTQVRVAFRAPGLSDPDIVAAQVLLRLIDDGMSTPLHREVFEDSALAYNVGADLEEYPDVGAFNLDAASSHENVPPIVEKMLTICTRIRDDAVGAAPEDLHKAKSRALWNLMSYQDAPQDLCTWYAEQEFHRRPVSIADHAQAVARVTLEDIARVASRIFTRDGLHVTTVGVQDKRLQEKTQRLTRGFS